MVKNIAKRIDKVMRAHGAIRERTRPGVTRYLFSDGYCEFIQADIAPIQAVKILDRVRARYGEMPRDALGKTVTVTRKRRPQIDVTSLIPSAHALQRFAEMKQQGGLTARDLHEALVSPARVLWAPKHGTWLFVGSRAACAVHIEGTRAHLQTILWADEKLWDLYPRLEETQHERHT